MASSCNGRIFLWVIIFETEPKLSNKYKEYIILWQVIFVAYNLCCMWSLFLCNVHTMCCYTETLLCYPVTPPCDSVTLLLLSHIHFFKSRLASSKYCHSQILPFLFLNYILLDFNSLSIAHLYKFYIILLITYPIPQSLGQSTGAVIADLVP